MSEGTAECPSCHGSVPCLEDGSPPRFCTYCNARMTGAVVAPPVGQEMPAADPIAQADPVEERLAAALARAGQAVPSAMGDGTPFAINVNTGAELPAAVESSDGLRPIPAEMAKRLGIEVPEAAPPPESPVIPVRSCCEDLDVRFNRARVCIQGAIMRFEFAFKALAEGVTDLVCELGMGDQSGAIGRMRYHGTLSRSRSWTPMINYTPRSFGCPAFTFHVGYRRDGAQHWFEAQFPCRIYPNTASAKDVIEQQVTNLNLEIKADRGSIVDLSNALNYLGQLKKDAGVGTSLERMLDRIEQVPPAMTPLELFPGASREDSAEVDVSLPPMPEASRVDALTLEAGGWKLHLLARTSLQMGRNKQCDITTRIFESDGSATKSRNDHISRYHARIDLHGDRCYLVDLGRDPETGAERESACGTYVDRSRVAPRRHAELTVGVKSRIGLGGPCGSGPNVFEFEALPWTCGMLAGSDCPLETRCPPGAPSCLVLRRLDGVRESFAIVWKCGPLGNLQPEFHGLHVWRQGGGFAWRIGRRRGWLVPGEVVADGPCEISVGPYRQIGV